MPVIIGGIDLCPSHPMWRFLQCASVDKC